MYQASFEQLRQAQIVARVPFEFIGPAPAADEDEVRTRRAACKYYGLDNGVVAPLSSLSLAPSHSPPPRPVAHADFGLEHETFETFLEYWILR